jgi:hypothetical protein
MKELNSDYPCHTFSRQGGIFTIRMYLPQGLTIPFLTEVGYRYQDRLATVIDDQNPGPSTISHDDKGTYLEWKYVVNDDAFAVLDLEEKLVNASFERIKP